MEGNLLGSIHLQICVVSWEQSMCEISTNNLDDHQFTHCYQLLFSQAFNEKQTNDKNFVKGLIVNILCRQLLNSRKKCQIGFNNPDSSHFKGQKTKGCFHCCQKVIARSLQNAALQVFDTMYIMKPSREQHLKMRKSSLLEMSEQRRAIEKGLFHTQTMFNALAMFLSGSVSRRLFTFFVKTSQTF